MTVHGFRIFSVGYLFSGINIYASSFFTALCNGPLSAFLSFTRTLLFRGGMVILLPMFLGLDGIWGAIIVAEGLGLICSVSCLAEKQKEISLLLEKNTIFLEKMILILVHEL